MLACTVLLHLGLSAAAPAEPFTVVTYNLGLLKVFGYNFVPVVGAREKAAPGELARFASGDSPDIILMEEVWWDDDARAIQAALRPLGYSFLRPDAYSILGLSSGLLLALKAPLRVVDWKFTPFSGSTLFESFARKGVLEATVQGAGGEGDRFALIGTHTEALDTDNGVPKDKAQLAAHSAQAAQILSAVQTRSDSGALPVLILGDFNVGPGYADEAYRKIADEPGIREAGAVLFPDAPIVTWDPQNPLVKYGEYPNEPPAKIDHVFFRDGSSHQWKVLDARRIFDAPVAGVILAPGRGAAPVPAPLSDHYGFEARLELSGAP
jgi:endonuclease/exonuclease/phosphatase family metal-dependent hydrolase